MAVIELKGYRCDRCNHEWSPRLKIEEEPTICPKCKSAYWNKPRRIDTAKNLELAREVMQKKKRGKSYDH